MVKRKSFPVVAGSILAFAVAGLLCSVMPPHTQARANSNDLSAESNARFAAQDPSQLKPGGPVRGVDVYLGKRPGGQVVARTKTDAAGNFTFGVVPPGSYMLTLAVRPDPNARSTASASIKYCYVTIKLPGGKKKEMGYDLTQNKAFDPEKFDPAKQTTARTGDPFVTFEVESDGATPCEGAINTSRSNIKVAQRVSGLKNWGQG
jgi:hypothetical protein